ncbi:MAG: hypothetical protein IJ593_05145 [Lachnospiraceae bacterium]|nr:hypothetical protein [Lachnospiraceae bacterium]
MNYYERYKKLILDKIEKKEITEDFVEQTTLRLNYYLARRKITQDEYNELIKLLNANEK